MKKVKTKIGDIFQIPIGDDNCCFGQVIENKGGVLRIMTFDTLYKSNVIVTISQIFSNKIILLTDTMDAKIYHGDWKVLYNTSIVEASLPKPYFKYGIEPAYLADYDGKKIRIATNDDDRFFDHKFSVAPIRIQNAMQAYFKLKDWDSDFDKLTYNYCLEKSILTK